MAGFWARSARSWTRSIEAPARYSSQVARVVSGFLKQRRYSANASGSSFAGSRSSALNWWRRKNSASAPISRSGNPLGWIRKNQCQVEVAAF